LKGFAKEVFFPKKQAVVVLATTLFSNPRVLIKALQK